jgi:peptidoglycan/LPS O-acetylase OafA/YrhL
MQCLTRAWSNLFENPPKYRYQYIAGFDSLRFLAFFAIFLFHNNHFSEGYWGVDFFFTLSSFLLTFLAFREYKTNGSFSINNFFMRRALRIYPLYYLTVFTSFCIFPLFFEFSLPGQSWKYWFFLSNFDYSDKFFPLQFLWSISVEEQFYLLFMILSPFFLRKIYPVILFFLIVFLVYSLAAITMDLPFYKTLFAQFPLFASGMWLGYRFSNNNLPSWIWSVVFFVAGFSGYLFFSTLLPDIKIVPGKFFFSFVFSGLILAILHLNNSSLFFKLSRLTDFLGRYTYGLYVYSGFVILAFNILFPDDNTLPIFAGKFVTTLIVAIISYHLLEKPFLNLKDKLTKN